MTKIKDKAEQYAEANTYTINNSYLTEKGKVKVEMWFQFPATILFIVLCSCFIYSLDHILSLKYIIAISLVSDIIFGLISYYVNLEKIIRLYFLTIGHKFILWTFTLITIGLLLYNGLYFYSAIVLVSKLGLTALFSPSVYLYTFLSQKYKMHPKWAFFKRFYGHKFPFEN